MTETKLLTSTQVGRALGKSSSTVVRMVAAGELVPLGKLDGPNGPYVFRADAIDQMLAVTAAPSPAARETATA